MTPKGKAEFWHELDDLIECYEDPRARNVMLDPGPVHLNSTRMIQPTPVGKFHSAPRYTPPDQVHPPPRLQTPEYGQRSAGTHPTGMHSC